MTDKKATTGSNRFPGHEYLFDDDDDDAAAIEPVKPKRTIAGGGDPAAFTGLATRIPGLRVTPVTREKIPVEKGWTGGDYWQKNADIVKSIRGWCAEYGRPNFAFCLGPKCGPGGDLVLEPDNQAGEDWLAKHVPMTGIMTVTRKGWFHRHIKPDPPDPESGFSRGNITDIFGSKKRHQQMATAAGYDVIIERARKDDAEYLAYIASERERADRDIPMGPIIDLKCAGGQAMCPGSVHATGYVYKEHAPWTLQAWNARPTFDPKWFPSEVWAERARVQMLVADKRDDDRVDAWWTPDRKYAAALAHVRKVPPKSTGENSSGTLMRLCSVLVRGFSLEPTQARELATYWARDICGHEPWSRKEIEHKLHDAQTRGAMAWGAKLQDRSRNPDARLEAAEQQVADMLAGRSKRAVFVGDHVHDLDLVALPEGFVDEPMAAEDTQEVPDAPVSTPRDDDDVWVEPDAMSMTDDEMRSAARSMLQRQVEAVNNVVDINVMRLVKDQEQGGHGATPEVDDDDDWGIDQAYGDEEETEGPTSQATAGTKAAPSLTPGSQEQLRQVFAQFRIDLADIRANNEVYHSKTDKEGNIVGLDTTTNNIALIFKYARAYKGQFAMNEMSQEQEFGGQRMIDATDLLLKQNIDGWFGREVAKERVRDAAHLACLAKRYNPVREYIDNLPEWDGRERWPLVATQILQVKANPEHAGLLLTRFGLSAMARALEPGCKADCMLVLQSDRQGLGKSTFAKVLFGAAFSSDQPLRIDSKDSLMIMARHWGMEIGEGEILSTPSKVMAFKAFLSQSADDVRLPYGHRVVRLPRRCVFVATTNEPWFLHDDTGNRRFWVVVASDKIAVKNLADWRDQLWAEAKHKVLAHLSAEKDSPPYVTGQWWLTDQEQQDNDDINKEYRVEDPWKSQIAGVLPGFGRASFTILDVLKKIHAPLDQVDQRVSTRVGKLLRELGAREGQRMKHARCWVLPDEDG